MRRGRNAAKNKNESLDTLKNQAKQLSASVEMLLQEEKNAQKLSMLNYWQQSYATSLQGGRESAAQMMLLRSVIDTYEKKIQPLIEERNNHESESIKKQKPPQPQIVQTQDEQTRNAEVIRILQAEIAFMKTKYGETKIRQNSRLWRKNEDINSVIKDLDRGTLSDNKTLMKRLAGLSKKAVGHVKDLESSAKKAGPKRRF